MNKANAQLALFHYLLHPWGAHTQRLQACVARLSIALLMGSLGSTKSSGHILLPSTFSPADPWAEFAVGCDGCTQLLKLGSGMGFLPPPPHPHRHFPALQLLWFPSVTGPSGATVSSSAEPSAMLKDQTLCWPGELRGCGFGENGLHAYFPFFLRNLACNTCTSIILKNFVRWIFISL